MSATIDYGIKVKALTLSPDGNSLAFVSVHSGVGWTIWHVNTDGTCLQQIGAESDQPILPVWSADSKSISSVPESEAGKHCATARATVSKMSLASNHSGLWLVDHRSGSRIRLPVEGDISEPVLSRDGKHAFCISNWERGIDDADIVYYGDVFSVTTDGTEVKQLTHFAPSLFRSSNKHIVAFGVLSMTQVGLAAVLVTSMAAGIILLVKRRNP